ncbi:XRE family transcriptional regulator [Amylibacter sp. SFDW26]|uniref:helix-turn-helix domain-containing protein n=1 Tax=Amylibacter sp. SFDW26 TaxID=2652722 RepID=UPI0012621D4F|nr:helix-turn-helix domain-containing protein [Amylibacter sp. SFDW26]KAB7615765.1 XRE family transcriptional regulator [Amylibacter sp. SFDW26]
MSNINEPSLITIARADGAQEQSAALNLGQRVRQLRKDRKWTLEQAAQEAGLARSTLSKIENEQMSPTFDAVKKLAEGLGISVPQLFTAPKSEQVMARLAVTKMSEGRELITSTYEHEMLAPELKSKAMVPYRARIRARSFDEFEGWVRHDGEEFLYVLSGVVKFFTEFYEPVEMRRGDSAYYDAAMGHNVISTSQDDAVVLWVTSLPS